MSSAKNLFLNNFTQYYYQVMILAIPSSWFINPSFHDLFPLTIMGHRDADVSSSWLQMRDRVHPGKSANLLQGLPTDKQQLTLTFTSMGNLE